MKRLAYIFCIGLLGFISSCKDEIETIYPYRYLAENNYYFTGLLEPNDFVIDTMQIKSHSKGTIYPVSIYLKGEYNSSIEGEGSLDKFKKQYEEIGAIVSNSKIRHGLSYGMEYTLSKIIKNISIRAISRYNDSHPEGANLSDIALFNTTTYDYNDKEKDYKIGKVLYQFDSNAILKYPPIMPKSYLDSKEYHKGSPLGFIKFKEKPTNEKQRISVKIDFTDGSSLEKEADIIIK